MSGTGNGTATVEARYGELEFFPADDPIGKALASYGEWAQAEIDLLSAFIGLGSTVIDIGANIGTHTVAFSRLVGPTGQVVAFEPQKEVFALLQRNVQRSGLPNAVLHQAGVGRVAGKMKVPPIDYEAHVNVGAISLVENKRGAAGDVVEILPIDSLSLASCHLVKLDAEGMEADVLGGMEKTISKARPVLFVECNGVSDGIGVLKAIAWDRYSFFLVATAAFNPNNHRSNADNFFGVARETNLLCVPQELAGLTPVSNATTRVTPIDDGDALAAALLSTPRYGDRTEHDRDLSWLTAQLVEQSERITQLHEQRDQAQSQLGELDELRATVSQLTQELETGRTQWRRTAQDVEASQAATKRAEFRAVGLAHQLERAERDSAEAAAALQASRQALQPLAAEVDALAATVQALRASTSWRVTKPLRWIRGSSN